MNKNAKAAIAVGAGVVLLLGGGSTLALWNSSQDLGADAIQSGTLKLANGGSATQGWYRAVDADHDGVADKDGNGNYLTTGSAIDASTYAVVPGDLLVYKATDIELTFQGGSLYYYVTLDGLDATATGYTVSQPALVPADAGSLGTADTAYGASTYSPVTPYVAGATTQLPVYHVASGTVGSANASTATFTATVAVAFGSATVTDEDATDANGTAPEFTTLDLSDATIKVQQTLKP